MLLDLVLCCFAIFWVAMLFGFLWIFGLGDTEYVLSCVYVFGTFSFAFVLDTCVALLVDFEVLFSLFCLLVCCAFGFVIWLILSVVVVVLFCDLCCFVCFWFSFYLWYLR